MINLTEEFLKLYPKAEDVRKSFCPYRVCPLGAHIDHQYGVVSGFAIDKGIHIVYDVKRNGVIELNSLQFVRLYITYKL